MMEEGRRLHLRNEKELELVSSIQDGKELKEFPVDPVYQRVRWDGEKILNDPQVELAGPIAGPSPLTLSGDDKYTTTPQQSWFHFFNVLQRIAVDKDHLNLTEEAQKKLTDWQILAERSIEFHSNREFVQQTSDPTKRVIYELKARKILSQQLESDFEAHATRLDSTNQKNEKEVAQKAKDYWRWQGQIQGIYQEAAGELKITSFVGKSGDIQADLDTLRHATYMDDGREKAAKGLLNGISLPPIRWESPSAQIKTVQQTYPETNSLQQPEQVQPAQDVGTRTLNVSVGNAGANAGGQSTNAGNFQSHENEKEERKTFYEQIKSFVDGLESIRNDLIDIAKRVHGKDLQKINPNVAATIGTEECDIKIIQSKKNGPQSESQTPAPASSGLRWKGCAKPQTPTLFQVAMQAVPSHTPAPPPAQPKSPLAPQAGQIRANNTIAA